MSQLQMNMQQLKFREMSLLRFINMSQAMKYTHVNIKMSKNVKVNTVRQQF